jgi:hypothetical protein
MTVAFPAAHSGTSAKGGTMAERIVYLEKGKPAPEVEVSFGHAHFGRYRLVLWDVQGHSPNKFSEGVNVDAIPDIARLPTTPAKLDRMILSWDLLISSFGEQEGQTYSAKVRLAQGGTDLPNGTFNYTGHLDPTTIMVSAAVRFITV